MEIPQLFVLILPGLVTPLVGWLNDPRMPQWLRCLIAAVVIIAVSIACAIYVHALTGNAVEDFVIIATWCSALSTTILEPLYKLALMRIPSLFSAFFKQQGPASIQPPTPPAPAA